MQFIFLGSWILGITGITLIISSKSDKIEIMNVRKELKKIRIMEKSDRESLQCYSIKKL